MDPARPENNLQKSFTDHNQSASDRNNIPPSMLPYIGRSILPTFTASPPDVTAAASYSNGASAAPAPSSSHAIGVSAAQGPPSSYATGALTAQGPPSSYVTGALTAQEPLSLDVNGAPAATASSHLNASYLRNIPPSMLRYIGKSVLPTFTVEYMPPTGSTASSSDNNKASAASGPPSSYATGAPDVTAPISWNVNGAPDVAVRPSSLVWPPSPRLDQLFDRHLNIQAPPPADAPLPADAPQLQQNGIPPAENVSTPPGCVANKKPKHGRQNMLQLMLRAFRSTPTGCMVVKEIYDYVLRNCRRGEYTTDDVVWERNVRHLLVKKPFFQKTGERKKKAKYWRFSEEDYKKSQSKNYRAKFAADYKSKMKVVKKQQNLNVPVNREVGCSGNSNINNDQFSSLMQPSSIDYNNSLDAQQFATWSSDQLASGISDMQNNAAGFSRTSRMPNSTSGMNIHENLHNYASSAFASNSRNSTVTSATPTMTRNINPSLFGSHAEYTQGNPEYWTSGATQGYTHGDLHSWTLGMNNDSRSKNLMPWNPKTFNDGVQGSSTPLSAKPMRRSLQTLSKKNLMPWNPETFNDGVQGSSTPLTAKPTRRSHQTLSKPRNIGNMLSNINGSAGTCNNASTSGIITGNPQAEGFERNREQMSWNNYDAAPINSNSLIQMNQMLSNNNTSLVETDLPNNSIQPRSYDLHSSPMQHPYNSPAQNASFSRCNAIPVRQSPYNRPRARVQHASRDLHNSIVQQASNDLRNSTVQQASYGYPTTYTQHASYNTPSGSASQHGPHDLHNTAMRRSSYDLTGTAHQSLHYGPDASAQRSSNVAQNASYQYPDQTVSYQHPVQSYLPNASDQPTTYGMPNASGQRPSNDWSSTLTQLSSFNAQDTLVHNSSYDFPNVSGQRPTNDGANTSDQPSSYGAIQYSSHNGSNIPVQQSMYSGPSTSTQQSSYGNTTVQLSSNSRNPLGQSSSYDASTTETTRLSYLTSLAPHEPGMHPDGSIDFSRWARLLSFSSLGQQIKLNA